MIYILLDTNIIIDMVVDRRNTVIKNGLLNTFIKLLDYGEITLLVPDIVITETNRNVDTALQSVENNIKNAKDSIKALYGINSNEIPPLDIEEYKAKAQKEINKAYTLYQEQIQDLKTDIHNTLELLFTHRNTKWLDDEIIMTKVLKRRVHKKAPFHREAKESYGDGTIIETIININKYIELTSEDKIIFVTGNYTDFSDSDNKNCFHKHIMDDLLKSGLDKQVEYYGAFNQLVANLKDCIERANLKEEFEAEMAFYNKQYFHDYAENLRNNMGLTTLHSFAEKIECDISESEFSEKVLDIFDNISNAYSELDDISAFLTDNLPIGQLNTSEFVAAFSSMVGCKNESNMDSVMEVLNWLEKLKEECAEIGEWLPDYISPGEQIEIFDVRRNRYTFWVEDLDSISPANGEEDSLEIKIVDDDYNTVASGSIEITYGYVDEDLVEGILDGCDEKIEYFTEDIIKKLRELSEEWDRFIEEKEKIVDQIKNILKV